MSDFAYRAGQLAATKEAGWGNTATSIGLGLLGGPVGWGLAGLHAAGSYGLFGDRIQRWLGGSDEKQKMPQQQYASGSAAKPVAKPATPAAAAPAKPATPAAATPAPVAAAAPAAPAAAPQRPVAQVQPPQPQGQSVAQMASGGVRSASMGEGMSKFAYRMGKVAAISRIADERGIDKQAILGQVAGYLGGKLAGGGGGQQNPNAQGQPQGGGGWLSGIGKAIGSAAKYMIPGYGAYQGIKSLFGGGNSAKPAPQTTPQGQAARNVAAAPNQGGAPTPAAAGPAPAAPQAPMAPPQAAAAPTPPATQPPMGQPNAVAPGVQ